MKITLHNDFHGTEAVVIAKDGIISSTAMRRAESKLCGMADCACGGLHGPQDVSLEQVSQDGAMRVYAKV